MKETAQQDKSQNVKQLSQKQLNKKVEQKAKELNETKTESKK